MEDWGVIHINIYFLERKRERTSFCRRSSIPKPVKGAIYDSVCFFHLKLNKFFFSLMLNNA